MKDMGDIVILSKEEYENLLKDSEKLSALESYGVDNWSGYSDAMMSIKEEECCDMCDEPIDDCNCEFCDNCNGNLDYNDCSCDRCSECGANLDADEECTCDEE